jgi:glutaconate CoA-transferase subunit A
VLVSVDEIVPQGELRRDGTSAIVTRNLISAIAELPGGAYPTSCLPNYATDYQRLREVLDGRHGSLVNALRKPDHAPSKQLQAAARIAPEAVQLSRFSVSATGPATIDELMAVRIARMLDNDSFASAGAVSPLANVAYRLAKTLHAPGMMIATFSCGHVDIAPGTMSLSMLEAIDARSAAALCGGDDTYSSYYQQGRVTHEIIGAAQIDGRARTNNLELRKPSGGLVRLPGQGGMSDVANMHRDYVVYVTRHGPRTLVDSVDTVSSARGVISATEREDAGYQPGDIWLQTNLCLFRYDEALGSLVVVERMPGVTPEAVTAQTGFTVIFAAHCPEMVPPTEVELSTLRTIVDPLGLRRLEFVGARERGALLDEILAADAEATRRVTEHCHE